MKNKKNKYILISKDLQKNLINFLDEVQLEAAKLNTSENMHIVNFCSFAIEELLSGLDAELKKKSKPQKKSRDQYLDETFMDWNLPEMNDEEYNKLVDQVDGFLRAWEKEYQKEHPNEPIQKRPYRPEVDDVMQYCSLEEIQEISKIAHKHKMSVHMDGARFANALVSLDISPAEMTWKSGVDVLTLGGTKNGCLAAEAIIFFKPEMVGNFPFLHKRSGQLLSKMRFISSQLNAYVSDDVWIKNARHANAMAKILSEGLNHFSNIELAYPTQSNEVFVHLPRDVIDYLNNSGYDVNEEELDGKAVRFVTAWDTKLEDINNLLEKLAQKYQ